MKLPVKATTFIALVSYRYEKRFGRRPRLTDGEILDFWQPFIVEARAGSKRLQWVRQLEAMRVTDILRYGKEPEPYVRDIRHHLTPEACKRSAAIQRNNKL